MDMSNYLGRCKEKGCDYALFATAEQIKYGNDFRDVIAGQAPVRVGSNGVFGRCANRHKFFPLGPVEGTYSDKHKCDSRCLNAKGNNCTCSCGGMNHGRGYAVQIIEAPAPKIAVPSGDASEAQIKFIKSLMAEKLEGDKLAAAESRLAKGLTKALASKWITKLKEI